MNIRSSLMTAFAAILISQTAQAATLIPIPLYPNSVVTRVIGINNNNVITGGYVLPGNSESGFFGTIDGTYTPFDFPGSHEDVEGRSVNNSNAIVASVSTSGVITAFERFADGTEKSIKVSDYPVDYSFAGGINSKGTFVVESFTDGVKYSCYGKNARCKSDLLIFGNSYSNPRGINDHGTVVGFNGAQGWVIYNGVSAWVNYPGAKYTYLGAVNNKNIATGVWTEQDNITSHPFLYDIKSAEFQDFKLPGLHNTFVVGINDAGLVLVNSDEGPFVYCTKKKTCPKQGIEVPDGKITKAQLTHSLGSHAIGPDESGKTEVRSQ